jgi:hypothetical protein
MSRLVPGRGALFVRHGGTTSGGEEEGEESSGDGADADWLTRSTAPGVFRSFHFNDSSQLGPLVGVGAWQTADWFYQSGSSTDPSISTEQKCSGTGSLYFEIPTNSSASAGGNWQGHFGTVGDLRLVGEGDEIFISYRCRWNAAMATITAQNEGTKFGGIEVARRESYDGSGSFEWDGSGENWAGITIQTYSASRIPIHYTLAYRRDENPSVLEGPAAILYDTYPTYPGTDLGLQNSFPSPGPCLYAGSLVAGQEATECWLMPLDEWVTFKYHLQVLSRRPASPYNDEFWDISFKFYAARFGEDFVLLHEWSDTYPGYGATYNGPVAQGSADTKFGKFRLMPYITGKDTADVHDTGKVWCDELIFSSQDIAAPRLYPAWRSGKTVGTVYELADTEYMGDPTFATFSSQQQDELIDAFNGNVTDWVNGRWLIVNAGGHAQTCSSGYTNAVVEMRFWDDAPVWAFIDEGTVLADITPNRYMLDGRPAARHTYSKGVYIPAGVMADGKERCGMVSGSAGLAQNWDGDLEFTCSWTDDTTGTWVSGPGFELFRLDPDDWFAHNTFDGSVHGWELQSDPRDAPQFSALGGNDAFGAPAQDPRTGDIYWVGSSSGNRRLFKWTASTDTWSSALVDSGVTTTFRGSNASPSFVDTIRNRLVILWFGSTNGEGSTDKLVFVDLDTYAVTTLALPVQGTGWGSVKIVHDTDNDRYCFIYREGAAGGSGYYVYRVRAMDPEDGVVSDLSGDLPEEMETGLAHHMAFIPDLHCLVWMTQHTAPIRFMPTL